MKTWFHFGAAAISLAVIAGCTAAGDSPAGAPRVVVSSYPLEFLATELGGDLLDVHNVIPAGAEPHDIELTPTDVATMERAELTLIVGGFQPAIDSVAPELPHVLDLAPTLDLQSRQGTLDPHFWLDPGRMLIAAQQIESALTDADPENTAVYAENLRSLSSKLEDLDAAYRDGLSECTYDSFVTGHAAFGYLADTYGLTEIAVAGIDPDTEPSPAALAATREEIRALGLPIVFAEPGDTKIAEVLAGELGIDSGVLNPIEAVTDGQDYLSLMHENLQALQGGLQCR